jgi:hypothetical protein
VNSRDNVDIEENSSAQAAFARAGEEFKEQAAEGLGETNISGKMVTCKRGMGYNVGLLAHS